MNFDILKGNWKIVQGKLKAKWSELTDNDFKKIEANYDLLEGYLVKYYGLEQDQAKDEAEKFFTQQRKDLEHKLHQDKEPVRKYA
jgi:uncharacterized protein YjbJ (UPF0337 family)